MIPLIPPVSTGISLVRPGGIPPTLAQASTDSSFNLGRVTQNLGESFTNALPNVIGAIVIGFIGLCIAFVVSWIVRSILKSTRIDDNIAARITGQSPENLSVAKWVGDAVFWIVILFTVIAVLQRLELTVVSGPLSRLLETVFEYLPRVISAAVLLAVAWLVATIVKTLVVKGLEAFHLDDRLAENTGVDPRQNSIKINETLGNALYWFIFLLFLPPILDSLELNGLLSPVQNLIDQFLAAIPKIILAGIIFAVGWLLAKVVRGIVTNLLSATGVDNLGRRVGLTSSANQTSLSGLAGTIVYVLILIPAAIAALNALDIDAISDPAIGMLEQILNFIPLLLAAGIVLTVFYFIGRFVGELVTNLLSSAGFDSVLEALGLPDISSPEPATPGAYPDSGTGVVEPGSTTLQSPTTLQPPTTGTTSTGMGSTSLGSTSLGSDLGSSSTSSTSSRKTPSEVAGLVVLVAIVLFGAVTATEILQLDQLTLIVRAVMEIAGQVLIGVLIFGIGIYIANLAFRLIKSSSGSSSNTLAQAARVAILAFVGAMALGQMGVAPNIVNLTFGLLLGAVAIAIAIAFGLGGREVAGAQLKDWLNELKR
ncbi:mechanosensitive ion channel [cf. Phormidesmis sp. LEGE 11477]|uniref:mechanosensitive ion channel n=1 Tax=cf. Phormidesmis sp. LEGE 11477 TaxID=1828680 RepID=UPI001882E2A6|nr:mechanosensitive ion channel [cf. Phormidesmis sp. LEGE 11477]MBE9062003.1 mechanosensitive ion channel [cf. Phormidesmis sp. LEGE 11477]